MNTAEAEMARNARLRKILGLSEIDNDDDEEVVDAKLLERAGVLTMIAALVNTPLTGAAEEERREKLSALRADGWIPPEEDGDGSSPGKCDPEENPQSQALPTQRTPVKKTKAPQPLPTPAANPASPMSPMYDNGLAAENRARINAGKGDPEDNPQPQTLSTTPATTPASVGGRVADTMPAYTCHGTYGTVIKQTA
jgi:hypothetical protein